MAHPLLVACAAALLIHAGHAATMQQTMTMHQTSSFSFTINHSLFMTYSSSSQRDQLLQQVFSLWKQVLGSVQATGLTIQFGSEAPGMGANNHIVKYTVKGSAPAKFDVKSMITQFQDQLPSAGISGVSTSASSTTSMNMNGSGSMNGGGSMDMNGGGSMNGQMGGGVTMSWTLQIQTTLTYANSAARDQILNQILSLFKKTFASYNFQNVKISVLSEQPSASGGNDKDVTIQITGTGAGNVDINSLTQTLVTALSTTTIQGVDQVSAGGDNSGDNNGGSSSGNMNMNGGGSMNVNGGGSMSGQMNGQMNGQMSGNMNGGSTMSWTLQIQTTLTYANQAARDKITNQILSLFKKTFASYNFQNVKLTVLSEQPSASGGNDKDVTIQITGTGAGNVDINSLTQTLVTALSTTTIQGVDQVSTGDNSDNGGSGSGNMNGGGSMNINVNGGGSMNGNMNGNGNGGSSGQSSGSGSGNTLFKNTLTVSTTDKTELNNILQQILQLFIQTYGTQYGLSNTNIKILTQRPNGQGGVSLTYQITGSSSQTIDTNQINSDFPTYVVNANINGVSGSAGGDLVQQSQIGVAPSSGSGSGSVSGGSSKNVNLVNTVTITSSNSGDINSIIQQILQTFISTYGSQYGLNSPKIKITSQKSNGHGGFTVTYTITGTASQPVNSQDLSNQFHDTLRDQGITNLDVSTVSFISGGGSSSGGNINGKIDVSGNGNTNGGSGSGSSFNVFNTVVLNSASGIDNIMQQILTLWLNTYSSQYQPQGAKIVVTNKKQVNGKWQITYKITGTSSQTIDVNQNNQDFDNTLQNGGNINGVVGFVVNGQVTDISGGGNGNGNGNGGDNGNGNGNGGGQFNIQNTVVLQYTSDSDLNNILQQILSLWQTTYSSQYQPTGAKIVVVNKKQVGGKWQVTYKITGSSSQTIDVNQNNQDFDNTLQNGGINGVVGFVINGQVTNIGGGGNNNGNDNGNGNGNGNVNGGGSGSGQFTFNDAVTITWTSTSQRDQILQQLLNLFKTTFSSQYQLTNLKIVFVSGSSGKSVSYRITGNSGSGNFNAQSVVGQFHGAITSAHISGVSVSGGGSGTGTGSGNGKQKVDITDSVWLTYGSNSERDQLLQQVLQLWQQVLASFQVSGLKISVVSSSAVSGQSGTFEVKYHITGFSVTTFSVQSQITIFRQQLTSANYPNIQVPGSSSSGGQSGVMGQTNAAQTAGPGDFSFTGQVYLAYRTPAERDVFLPQLQVIWTNSLNDYIPSNVKLTFVSEKNNIAKLSAAKGGQPVSQVTYKLTGSVQNAFNIADAENVFMQTVKDAHLGRVIFDLSTDL